MGFQPSLATLPLADSSNNFHPRCRQYRKDRDSIGCLLQEVGSQGRTSGSVYRYGKKISHSVYSTMKYHGMNYVEIEVERLNIKIGFC